MCGSGFSAVHVGTAFEQLGFRYWDDKAFVHQSLQHFDGEEIEIMVRLSLSPDSLQRFPSLALVPGVMCGPSGRDWLW